MVLEHAVLEVLPGQEEQFEEAFREAQHIIASIPGFISLRLERCLEIRARYLLLVEWQSLQDHTVGFRGSPRYDEWRHLLHRFYDPFPVAEHYESLIVR